MLLSLFDYKISTKTVCNCVSYSIFGIYMESNFFLQILILLVLICWYHTIVLDRYLRRESINKSE